MRLRFATILCLLAMLSGNAHAQSAALKDADAHFQAQRWADAERSYQAILKADSTVAMAWYRLGRVYLEGLHQPARAQEHFVGSLRHGFAPIFSQFGIARALVLQNKQDEALAILEQFAATGYWQPETVTGDTILNKLGSQPRYINAIAAMKRNVEPCEHSSEFRQLDFWVGNWAVFNQNNQRIGTSRIERFLRGCGIQENWTGGLGREGKSLNFYDKQKKTWRQVWLNDQGGSTDYTSGQFANNALVFHAKTLSPKGDTLYQKLTFKNVAPDTVHQIFETSPDKGATWRSGFYGIYVRQK